MNRQCFLIVLLCVMAENVIANSSVPTVFTNPSSSEVPAHVSLPPQALAGHYVKVNPHALKSNVLTLDLPNKKQVRVVRKRFINQPNGSGVWEGDVSGVDGSSAILTQHGLVMAGVIRMSGDVYKLQHVGKGVHVIVQVSPHEPMPEHDPVMADTYSYSGSSSALSTLQASDDGSQIDIMVAYSSDTTAKYGGVDGVNAHIALAIAESNEAYNNSAINTQLRLVHTLEVTNSSGNFSTDLNNLRGQNDGVVDEVHAARDSYGADMVSWFIEDTTYCGIAYVNTGDLSQGASTAFSVVSSGCATGYYSTAHELGHNMGSNHDRENAGSAVAYSYSYGFQDTNNTFRSIMAYNCSGGCTRQRFFSNPELSFNGVPTGVYYLNSDSADNARSINQTRFAVSQWRSAVVGTPAQASFSADCQLLQCSFTDTSRSDDAIVSWTWDFGDAQGSASQAPSHTYASAGTYVVTLTVEDSTGAINIVSGDVAVNDGSEQPPSTPMSPDAIEVSTGMVEIYWFDVDNEQGYTLERQNQHPKNGKWVGSTQFNLPSDTTLYTETLGGGLFRYRLQAVNDHGASDWSGWSAVVTVTSTSTGGGKGGNGGGKGKPKK
mgnify:CR=1 FL=1